MTDSNQHIHDALKFYLDKGNPTRHALMLKGVWGSGKTHFIKEFIETWLQNNPAPAGSDYNPACYISLNGLQTIEELQKQLFIQLYPMKGKTRSAAAKFGISGINLAIPFVSISFDPDKLGETFDSIFTSLDRTILFFDDLERCDIPVKALFGFINQFVEHNRKKVILIANEEKIPDTEYAEIKEKLIGVTLELQTSPKSILQNFINEMPDSAAKTCAEQNKSTILRVFHELHILNYRSLRIALANFSHFLSVIVTIFPAFMEGTENAQEARLRLLILILVMSIQFREGSLDCESLANYQEVVNKTNETHNYKIISLSPELGAQIKGINLFFPNHYQEEEIKQIQIIHENNAIIPYTLISQFLLTGLVDTQRIKVHLQQHFLFKSETDWPLWYQLYNLEEIRNQNNLDTLLNKLQSALDDNTLKDSAELIFIAAIFIQIEASCKWHPQFLSTGIADYFINYMNKFPYNRGNERFEFTQDNILYNSYSLEKGLKNNQEFQKLLKYYEGKEAEQQEVKAKKEAEEILRLIASAHHQFQLKNWLENNISLACFQYLNLNSVADKILSEDKKIALHTLYLVVKRYESIELNSPTLDIEKPWFGDLKTELEARVKNAENGLIRNNIAELSRRIFKT